MINEHLNQLSCITIILSSHWWRWTITKKLFLSIIFFFDYNVIYCVLLEIAETERVKCNYSKYMPLWWWCDVVCILLAVFRSMHIFVDNTHTHQNMQKPNKWSKSKAKTKKISKYDWYSNEFQYVSSSHFHRLILHLNAFNILKFILVNGSHVCAWTILPLFDILRNIQFW